jgi:YesN/AraC family two-component response regulator
LLEQKKYFLSKEFNQQNVAKKIKTNTTYLSHIVNTNFNKSFSEYANELKINYVIDELLNNPVYRKYSTQAIAESVGFKNAISFTKSFKKRAGVSPTQFIHKIENNN